MLVNVQCNHGHQSHQPSESHLVANSELKSPPNDALVAGVVTMNAASVPNW